MSNMHGGMTRVGAVRRTPISGGDAAAQRALNAQAPKIDHLLRRTSLLFRPHRAALILTAALVLASAGLTVLPPLLTQSLFDDALFPASGGVVMPLLIELSVAMIVIYLVSTLLAVWQTYLTATVGNKVMGDLRVRLFTHLQAMELSFFTRTKTGIIQSRLQNDVGGVAGVLSNTVSSVLGNFVQVAAALVAMFLLNWQLAIVSIVLMPLLVLVQRRVGQVRARIAAQTQESLSEMTAITQESLSVSGILLAKSFNRPKGEIARYGAENDRQVGLQVRQAMSGQWFLGMVQVFLSAIPVVVYIVAGWLLTGGATDITAGTIVAFTAVQARMLFPLVGIMRTALDLQTSGALFARIFEYLDLKPSITDAADAAELPAGRTAVGVDFDHVTFRYPDAKPGETSTLDDVSFQIPAGTYAAFVGPSGAGKTTVSYLIPRLYEATAGAVRVAGHDVRDLTMDSLMAHIGIVSQETYLFHATIAENLRYARTDATQTELEDACRKANIHDTISGFPDGYDTVVGERGYRLSGGEKQRIAIARVLLKDPDVLVLDEATSALDSISESVVQEALDTAASGRTTIAIAHRLSTIVNADQIFVVERGRVVEHGTHADLLAAGGAYSRLYLQQTRSPELAA
ncbi:ABC transporter ATP-binding protein [Microbacterium sp. X-17]|uniref:ABC transporter ATP-binding protein n=1 Tax=Microbacterium sp. X-17 TaxID=3144404 RepID=UPI0031F5044A